MSDGDAEDEVQSFSENVVSVRDGDAEDDELSVARHRRRLQQPANCQIGRIAQNLVDKTVH